MDFEIPPHVSRLLEDIDAFIEREIKPLEDAHPEYFDHRREFSRTDWERGGIPVRAFDDLVQEMKRRADKAGFLRLGLPKDLGGANESNLTIVLIREHLSARGLGLHGNLPDESSIVPSFPMVHILHAYGSPAQKARYLEGMVNGDEYIAFALTEPDHGSDATWLETTARREGNEWVIDGVKRFNSGVHKATADLVFARTSGAAGDVDGITAFIVPMDAPGLDIPYYHWTFNMPSDHAEVVLDNVRVPHDAILHREGDGLRLAQHFVHQNRIRQAAQSVGVARFCVKAAVDYALARKSFGKPLATHQALQFAIADMHTDCELLRNFVFKVAWEMDRRAHEDVSDLVAMANFRANRLACNAADLAIQVHGGIGYTRAKPFEHFYRHHRRYRITEGSDEIQLRKIAAYLFGYAGPRRRRKPKDGAAAAAR